MTRSTPRPLLPPWAGTVLVGLVSLGIVVLVLSLAHQNRQLKSLVLEVGGPKSPPPTVEVGDSLASLKLYDLAGNERSDLLTEVEAGSVVAFFTTTCPYCEATIPKWDHLFHDLSEVGIPFLGISLHDQDRTTAYTAKTGITWPVRRVANLSHVREFKLFTVPLTVVLAANGDVAQVWRGQLRDDDVAEILDTSRETAEVDR